jgi:hypothetical protein
MFNFTPIHNISSFFAITRKALYAHPSRNSLILGICEKLIKDPEAYEAPFYAVIQDESAKLALAALMTPPHHLIVAGTDVKMDAIQTLVRGLLDHQIQIPGAIGPTPLIDQFMACYQQETGGASVADMNQGVYELKSVRQIHLPQGHFRKANQQDADVILAWYGAFQSEALNKETVVNQRHIENLIATGSVYLWETADGIVSMAMKTRPITSAITISGVYTPPTHRRKGYATACVASLCQSLLDSGYAAINLFTDLANPTSNDIYRQIGFKWVCKFRMISIVKDSPSKS